MSGNTTAAYGGKGNALRQLKDAGFNVPPFIVLPVSFFKDLHPGSDDAAQRIEEISGSHISEWRSILGKGPVAVRSSAVAEDSAAHSFAGQFKTLLDVPFEDVPGAIAAVWASAANVRAYADAHGLAAQSGMAVILQKMVRATAAGVAFSAHPVAGTAETIINAVAGLGDKLVDGSANGDEYAVERDEIIVRRPASGECVLSDAQILLVAVAAKRAHDHFGGPQDIEFAFEEDALFILQSRPITTLPRIATIWDNSNIVESYPGLTQPLTFSFIEKMYDAVYRQFSALLGVGKGKIERHAAAFSTMLGLLNGRVYYNLNSWYEALSLLPGYNLNAAFMEKMMGVKEKPDIKILPDKISRLGAWWEVASAAAGIVKNGATARKQARHFTVAFNKVYSRFAAIDPGEESLPALWGHYQSFETLMVEEWKAPLVNDFFAMIYFGLLQKLCASAAPDLPNLHNQLLAGSDGVLTTEPMKALPKIADAMAAHPALLHAARSGNAEDLYEALQRPEYADAWSLFQDYIDVWGERSIAELKLETITYRQDPVMLMSLLQSYLLQDYHSGSVGFNDSSAEKQAAEMLVKQRLKGKWRRRMLFNHVLRNARYFVAQRENLRYYRTRGFGTVRRMMLAIGERLAAAKVIAAPRDVFWLTLQETETAATDSAPMQEAVLQRQTAYESYAEAELPQRIISYGVPRGLISRKRAVALPGAPNGLLQGVPCSAGIVRAPVRLVTYSDEMKSLNGAILATYATDPGFVVLFASAGGILTERGSLLSHAAIVSREMGIPCIVGIEGLMQQLKDGDVVEMDGSTGAVRIVSA